ncbi:MAG: ribonuclease R [Candidatus Marinimicrobia bacterium]|nr:ribonuclease R [Candidatus Neomarinimicrobiota bacterium]MCF7851421.1 ribonuclease R [Candidatus Neomarinimicrobiota bacterium]
MDRSMMKKKVLDILKQHSGRWFKPRTLMKYTKIQEKDYRQLKTVLIDLNKEGKIDQKGRRQYAFRPKQQEVTGVLAITSRGFGFVELKDGSEVFIPASDMQNALHRDLVRIRILSRKGGDRRSGKITEVIRRHQSQFIGTYHIDKNGDWVTPTDKRAHMRFTIDRVKPKGLKDGQLVVINLIRWDEHEAQPLGQITDILGFPGDPGLDKSMIIHSYDLPTKWSEKAKQQARSFSEADIAEALKDRLDLRGLTCFTIDPETAQDFDDAVSIEKIPSGWRLGVHIADVSHYVQPGSPIDRGAKKRGTSVYLVGSVIHMLPEELASDLCSLKPRIDRLAMSCLMDIDKEGNVNNYSIANSVINSNERFSYESVEKIIHGEKGNPFSSSISEMEKLRQVLFRKRKSKGSIDLELPEPIITLDEKGFPTEIKASQRLKSHRLVEEFMLLANQVVAGYFERIFRKHSYHGLYRVHEPPSMDDVEKLRSNLGKLGIKNSISHPVQTMDYQKLVDTVRESPYRYFIEKMALRSMTKAKYSIENKGHFGLAFHTYTHFTSPIRRYPDLVVHRLLKNYLLEATQEPYTQKSLAKIAIHCSERERVAVDAERDHIKSKQLQYLSQHVGESFDGIISGVVNFGFFVELADTFVEGLVHAGSMEDDYYDYDEDNYQLVGRRKRNTYRLGDKVRISVLSVNISEGLADFTLQAN